MPGSASNTDYTGSSDRGCRYTRRSFLDSHFQNRDFSSFFFFFFIVEIRAVVILLFTCLDQPLIDNWLTNYEENHRRFLEIFTLPAGKSLFFSIQWSAYFFFLNISSQCLITNRFYLVDKRIVYCNIFQLKFRWKIRRIYSRKFYRSSNRYF